MTYVREFDNRVISVLSTYSKFKRDLAVLTIRYMSTEREDQLGLVLSIDQMVRQTSGKMMSQLEQLSIHVSELSETIALELDDPNPQLSDPLDIQHRQRVRDFIDNLFTRVGRSVLFQLESDGKQARLSHDRLRMKLEMLRSVGADPNVISREIDKHAQSFNTTRRDALGRVRDSEQFIMTELRYGAYRALNIAILYMLAMIGETTAKIDRPNHKYDGVEFEIFQYDELEDELFHPNALAIATPT